MKFKIIPLFILPFIFLYCYNSKRTVAAVNTHAGLVLRTEPTSNSAKIDFMPLGSELIILDTNGPEETLYNMKSNWYKIKYNNKTGWAFGGFIKIFKENDSIYEMQNLIPDILVREFIRDEKTFYFDHLNKKFKIDSSGNLLLNDNNTVITKLVDEDWYIEKVNYANFNNDIILLYEITNDDYGRSELVKIDCTNNTYKKTLNIQVGGFNLTNGLIENQFIYVATIGRIAKLNLYTGTFAWKSEDLYEKFKFNDFDDIEIKNDKVIFIEGTYVPKDCKRRKIEVNKNSGKIEGIVEL